LRLLPDPLNASPPSDEGRNEDVHRSLVESLYASTLSLAFGALAGVMLSLAAAFYSPDWLVDATAILICIVAVGRTVATLMFNRRRSKGGAEHYRVWERIYELGAWIYAALLGALALFALTRSAGAVEHLVAVALAIGYAGGISGRNAGQVRIAIGQICLALGPTSIGLWLVGQPGYMLLGVAGFLMILGLAEISATTHRILIGALVDKRDKGQLATRFERLARHDSLTGLENRMAMQARLSDMLQSAVTNERTLALLWLDLDRFKEINDSLGHIVGDRLLCEVAARLHDVLEERGALARFGGDEFVMLCPGMDAEEATKLAADVLDRLVAPFAFDVHQLSISGSIGIAIGPHDGTTSDELMLNADVALYDAKRNGRNRFAMFSWAMKEKFDRVRELELGLRQAIDQDALNVHFQPIIELATGRVTCCEALVRWTHPELGNISPGEFIPAAEHAGLIGPLTECVIRKACAAAAQWPDDVRVAVNISPDLLKSAHFSRVLLSALMSTGIQARRLDLEVTESLFLEGDGHTHVILSELRRIGVHLSLDDFGTGYSSLSYLRSYRFDTLKIDQSFIRGAGKSAEDRAVIAAMSFLADRLDMETVAEGIETEEQLRCAMDAGFSHVQGYMFCSPCPQDKLLDYLAKGPVAIRRALPADTTTGRRRRA
jgi:diguanylate cyclase (GGDEF)-like protein